MAVGHRTAQVTELHAYQAMLLFLERHFDRTGSDDIGALLGSLGLLADGVSADPAAYDEWRSCLDSVIAQTAREAAA